MGSCHYSVHALQLVEQHLGRLIHRKQQAEGGGGAAAARPKLVSDS